MNYILRINDILKYVEKNNLKKYLDLEKQNKEWILLNFINSPITFEKSLELNLPIDTKYFNKNIDIPDNEINGEIYNEDNNNIFKKISHKFNLIFLDPPFNTGNTNFVYNDTFEISEWTQFIDETIQECHRLLKNTGSLFLHLDENSNHIGKSILLKYFNNTKEIIYNTNATYDIFSDTFSHKSFSNDFVLKHQTIYISRKSKNYYFNKLWNFDKKNINLGFKYLDLLSEKNNEKTGLNSFSFYIEKYVNDNFKKVYLDNEFKVYPLGSIWNDIFSFTQSFMRVSENIGFSSSQKPENLMRRIIQSSTKSGDLILDPFAGSGTTLIVALKLKRFFVGIEKGEHFNNYYLQKEEITNKTFEKLKKHSIVKICKESKNSKTVILKKLGLLGRIKNTINGDKNFYLIDGRKRYSFLSREINWNGGGIIKYY